MQQRWMEIFELLLRDLGEQQWWPAQTPFEVMVGAILTQNTAWTNVERAIAALRAAELLGPSAIASAPLALLEEKIRPAGFFRQKAGRLQALAALVAGEYGGEVGRFLAGPLEERRALLLGLSGIGPETADSILLYAGDRPSFVVDAYTYRIFTRLGLLHGKERYAEVRERFMTCLPTDARLFNEYHALIVVLAKRHCRKRRPVCATCPLASLCPTASL